MLAYSRPRRPTGKRREAAASARRGREIPPALQRRPEPLSVSAQLEARDYYTCSHGPLFLLSSCRDPQRPRCWQAAVRGGAGGTRGPAAWRAPGRVPAAEAGVGRPARVVRGPGASSLRHYVCSCARCRSSRRRPSPSSTGSLATGTGAHNGQAPAGPVARRSCAIRSVRRLWARCGRRTTSRFDRNCQIRSHSAHDRGGVS
jgi:hypothetical protein